MSDVTKTPSKKILANPFDGKEITDKLGRKLRLRKPDVLDFYDLMSAIGEDSKNPVCNMMATRCLYVCTIDGLVVQSPKSLAEFRMNLKRIGEEGLAAIAEFVQSTTEESTTEQEEDEKIKK